MGASAGGWAGLILGGVGWLMIIVATGTPGSSGKGVDNSKIAPELLWSANALRWFIVVGWIIYPVGFLLALSGNESVREIAYNVADVINKVGFGVACVIAAKTLSSLESEGKLQAA